MVGSGEVCIGTRKIGARYRRRETERRERGARSSKQKRGEAERFTGANSFIRIITLGLKPESFGPSKGTPGDKAGLRIPHAYARRKRAQNQRSSNQIRKYL